MVCKPPYHYAVHTVADWVGCLTALIVSMILHDNVKDFARETFMCWSVLDVLASFLAFFSPFSIAIVNLFTTGSLGYLPPQFTLRNAWPHLVISGGCDVVCALAAGGQLSVAMTETADTENKKAGGHYIDVHCCCHRWNHPQGLHGFLVREGFVRILPFRWPTFVT